MPSVIDNNCVYMAQLFGLCRRCSSKSISMVKLAWTFVHFCAAIYHAHHTYPSKMRLLFWRRSHVCAAVRRRHKHRWYPSQLCNSLIECVILLFASAATAAIVAVVQFKNNIYFSISVCIYLRKHNKFYKSHKFA